jgi:hypothetical protein
LVASLLVAPSAMTSCLALILLPVAETTVHSPFSLSNVASTTSNSSLSWAPALDAALAMRASRLMRFTAAHAAWPSFSFEAPM